MNKEIYTTLIKTEQETIQLGCAITDTCEQHGVIFLEGEIGSGKTTLCRSIIKKFGFLGTINSPTYTLIETYKIHNITIHHFDLYRLTDAEELEFLGLKDYFDTPKTIQLIEWPHIGKHKFPVADLNIELFYENLGRKAILSGNTEHGNTIVSHIKKIQNNPTYANHTSI